MKKRRQPDELLVKIMRITFLQGILFVLFMGISSAESLIAQELLNKRITLTVSDVSLEKALAEISEQAGVKFVYSYEMIEANRKINLKAKNQKLEEIFEQILTPFQVQYQINAKGRILLKRVGTNTESTVLDHAPEIPSQRDEVAELMIEGIVQDEQGNPLPGVSVVIKGSVRGTITDEKGAYQLTVDDATAKLVFSYVGFIAQEVAVGNRNKLDVTLAEDQQSLKEVVVVGYGEQKKISVTGAVSTVNSEVLQQNSSASLANALAGRLPGLTSMQSGGGQPGRDDATMYLRGISTLNSSNPLILIDGVPRDNIRTLDANEVASVSILKDASATAVFGVRGANGVILITTKRGSEGKTELTINTEQSFSSFTREPERLHSLEYMALRNEASRNDGIDIAPFSEEVMDRYRNPLQGLDINDPEYAKKAMIRNYMYPDHDYYREYISRYSPQTRVNINASGGTNKVSYFVNGAFLHQGGNLKTEPKSVLGYDPSSKMDRFSFRSNLDYKITKNVKSFLNIGSYIEKVNMPASWLYGNDTNWMMRDLLYQAQTILPITPGPVTIDGFGVKPGMIVDPGYLDRSAYEIMNRYGYRNEVRSNLNASFGMDWDLGTLLFKGLTAKGMISYDSKSTTAMQGEKSEMLYLANVNPVTNEMTYSIKRQSESLLHLVKGADSRYNINMQASLNYANVFGTKHNVTGMFLYQRDNWESAGGEIPFNVLGVAARATYGFDGRYLAEFNMGYNGSEQFAPKKRFGFFPAVSAGWVISQEAFLHNSPTVTNLKLRASYGKVGNDKMGGDRFLFQDNITLGGGPLGSLGLGRGVSQGLLGNPNLSWEIAKKQNYGLDLELFGALSLSFDYFIENRTDILISRGTIPVLQGIPLHNIPRVNLGEVDNKGFEIELTYNKTFVNDLRFNARGNFGFNKNVVKFIDESQNDESYVHRYRRTGYSLNQNWGYKIDYSNGNGYFNSQEELDTYLTKIQYGAGQPRVGDFKYMDLNNDGVIDVKDEAPIGSPAIPRINYGLSLSLDYKSFDLTVFFQGIGKYSGGYAHQGVYENIKSGTYFNYHKTAWTPERYANGEEITYPALSTQTTTNHRANDFFIMNRSFIRLKNVVLGYTLPATSLQKIGIQKFRIYVSAQNYLTWDKLKMGHLDPENSNPLDYPVTKMLNLGLNITF